MHVFTGLIAETGEISSLSYNEGGARLTLSAPVISKDASIGDSVSVNGACLTVVGINGPRLSFDVSGQTLKTTNLGRLKTGQRVNLEPALKAGDRLAGHFVTGHIDGTGSIISKTPEGDVFRIVVGAGRSITDCLVDKGSVAIDGISLTVVEVLDNGFSVVIIPHTGVVTTLGYKKAGDTVNIEVDILGKYVSKFLTGRKDRDLMETLRREGFA